MATVIRSDCGEPSVFSDIGMISGKLDCLSRMYVLQVAQGSIAFVAEMR